MLEGISCKKELYSGGGGVCMRMLRFGADRANMLTVFKQQ